ncbi:hypothetical protein [Kitasatospora sp. GAS204B]|uniref:hypothetical protein n=1 Tax=unclassified Kitasatospora TaxID=2633591 RepID=UPI0024761007|nr:hypothetical protein [Kitasatospora sp. GAS204B]MDH6118011.1 hypothetical protein [Kitasatospora sp. GAS204B]
MTFSQPTTGPEGESAGYPAAAEDPEIESGVEPDGRQLRGAVQQFVTMVFNGEVDARGGVFGVGTSGKGGRGRGRLPETGKLTADEVADTLDGYQAPACYPAALALLRRNCVVELSGSPGMGKSAGALALLREVVSGSTILLAPTVTLNQLAVREYHAGFGYVVPGRVADATPAEDVAHLWHRIRDQVSDAKSFLVVTTASAALGSPWRQSWERPDPMAIIVDRLGGHSFTEQELKQFAQAVPPAFRPQDLMEVVRQIAQGGSPERAMERFAVAATEIAGNWFQEPRSPREILGVAALAFTAGTAVRTVETELHRLEEQMAAAVPSTVAEPDRAEKAVATLPGHRKQFVDPAGLVTIRTVADGVRSRRVMDFREPAFRERVLSELYDRYDNAFWDGVRGWLNGTVRQGYRLDPELKPAVATGLALLAKCDIEEVDRSYLRAWAGGAAGWAGQETAVFTLWLMCLADDTLAPVALTTAESWARDGAAARRWAAVVAFAGELGLRYPSRAIAAIWRAIRRGGRNRQPSQQALARLFGLLTSEGEQPGRIPAQLDHELYEGGGSRPSVLVIETVLELVEVTDDQSGVPVVMVYLHRWPERTAVVARLWAAALRHRPSRQRALGALATGLAGLSRISDQPADEAARLGEHLARALPPDEYRPLRSDLSLVAAGLRRTPGQARALIEILLAAVAKADRHELLEGDT